LSIRRIIVIAQPASTKRYTADQPPPTSFLLFFVNLFKVMPSNVPDYNSTTENNQY
jgi:hypothetical protein